MATRNVFFNNFESKGEQDLIEDLVIESIQIYGIDTYYMPKTYVDYDNLYGESDLAVYKEYYTVPMYINTVEGFGGESKIAYVMTDNSWSADEPEYIIAAGVTNLVMSSYGEEISLVYDEINVYGPMTRYGIIDVENNDFALSNLIAEGFTSGYATTEEESIILVSSSSGTLSFKTIVSLEVEQLNTEEKSFLDTLLEPLPGDATTKAVMLIFVALIISLIFMYLVVSLRRTNKEVEEQILSASIVTTSEDDIEIMVDIESDDEPTMAINMDAEELVVKSAVSPKAVIVDEEQETLQESLTAKVESGEGNSRLQRRMKRKQQRDLVEMTEKMVNNIPQPIEAIPAPIDAVLPVPTLPDLPPPADAILPGMPLPNMPLPQKEANCTECSAKFTIKDLRLTKVTCPICSAVVEL